MSTIQQDPIHQEWTTRPAAADQGATARTLCSQLAPLPIDELVEVAPSLAAAVAELALLVGVPWRFSPDDPAVALLRMLARVAIIAPDASGPHCDRLGQQLGERPT